MHSLHEAASQQENVWHAYDNMLRKVVDACVFFNVVGRWHPDAHCRPVQRVSIVVVFRPVTMA